MTESAPQVMSPARKSSLETLERLPIKIAGSHRRVIPLQGSAPPHSVSAVFELVDQLGDAEVAEEYERVWKQFGRRHHELERVFEEHYETMRRNVDRTYDEDQTRRLLLGAYFTMEYAIEAAALFNPSIVPHPDQSGLDPGCLRFVMSFRATGEGHVSSVVFQTGVIDSEHRIHFDRQSPYSARTRLAPDQYYVKPLFRRKLTEMVSHGPVTERVLDRLPEHFTLTQLEDTIQALWREEGHPEEFNGVIESMRWLARSNYELSLDPRSSVSDLIIFPTSENELRGIEDVRLVQFTDDEGHTRYYGTYTAYNGHRVLPMLMETEDFRRIKIHTLNGACVQNKGMALFPRPINGHYAMCARLDGRNLYLMYSDYVHFWESAEMLTGPKYPWEFRIMGNCGSPIETHEGWLLLTHGVGPMRQYSIGALLLDLEDPQIIRGRLKEPLLTPLESERDGYVPNVVYSCGAMVHGDRFYIPYAMADEATSVARLQTQELIERLIEDGP